jgi:glycosyltransferase involved in cell wall biosynthesis
MADIASYFNRFGFGEELIQAPPHPNIGMVVVIPCHNEPDLLGCLESLARCNSPKAAIEVIVIINEAEICEKYISTQNSISLEQGQDWASINSSERLNFWILQPNNLPQKHAGVGLARKIGMDEAVRRFDRAGRGLNNPIVCFDADSQCDSNYLVEIEDHFKANPKTPGCSIYFEHPLAGNRPANVYQAITLYELHLRYYVEACRYTGHPAAFHTIGSSMAVRAGVYIAQGGMNRKKAGEDFYFLNKIIPLGNFTELNSTRVIPSPRPSDRVPFGTGRAVETFLRQDKGELRSYPIQAFADLKRFFNSSSDLFEKQNSEEALGQQLPFIQAFLSNNQFEERVNEILANTTTRENFLNRFFKWFNPFLLMKYVHYARDAHYGDAPVEEVASKLLELVSEERPPPQGAEDLLKTYRDLQRKSATIK